MTLVPDAPARNAVDLARLRFPIGLMMVVFVAIAFADYLAGWTADALPLQAVKSINTGYRDEIATRVALLTQDRRTTDGSEKSLGVFLGASTVMWGIDSAVLDSELGEHYRWINLGWGGGQGASFALYSAPLLRSSLEPPVVVLGVHAYMFGEGSSAGWQGWQQLEAMQRGADALADRQALETPGAASRLLEKSWLYRNRTEMRAWSRWGAHALAGDGAVLLGLNPGRLLGVALEDPWVDAKHIWELPPVTCKESLETWWMGLGLLDSERYERGDTAERRSFRRFVRRLVNRDMQVIVVLMPEHSAALAQEPATATALLYEVMADLPEGATVVDMRASVPDTVFVDCAHPTDGGKVRLTQAIAEAIRPHLRSENVR